MRKIYIIIFLSFLFFTSQSQDFLGISTGNFSGVSGVMIQPASIVDSRYKFDINLYSTGLNYSNNYFLVNRDALLKFNKNSFSDYQTFKAKYLSEASLKPGERVFLNIGNRTQLPLSFMVTTGTKSAIALNIQSRSMIQGRGITQELAKMAYNGFYSPALNNNIIDASGFNLKALNWAEVGFTYGRVLYASNKHFLKAAVTGKYLAGVASISMGSNDIRFSVNNDSSINLNTNRFEYNHNKNADFDMTFNKNFSPDANAVGFDAGVVYEYRGNFDKFKYIRNDDEKPYLADRRDVNKYIFKLGVSLVDVGMFRFKKPDNVNAFTANITNWNIASANYNTIREFDTALANRVVALPGSRYFNTYLPAALSVQFDLRFVKGFYLNAMAYRPVNMGNNANERFNSYGFYTITPRWESRHIGIYIPYTIVDKNAFANYRENLLGATVRLGPLFIGSSNLGTMLFKQNLSAADVHVGLKIGITYGKPNKSSTYITRIFSKKAETQRPQVTQEVTSMNDTVLIKRTNTELLQRNDTSRLLIDYNKGKIYDNPGLKGNIIIVNNYYYGNAPAAPIIKSDTIISQANPVQYYQQPVQQKDSVLSQKNKRAIDENKKLITDSINNKKQQLDSLINEMQMLRMQMDSLNVKDSTSAGILPINKKSFIGESDKKVVPEQRVDTIASGTFGNQIADSLPVVLRTDSMAGNYANIKKKSFDSSKVREAFKDAGTAKARTLPALKDQQNDVSQQVAATPVSDQYNRQRTLDQDRLMNDFKNETGKIRSDIARLQASANENNRNYGRNNTLVPVMIPVANKEPVKNIVDVRRDTIYIRDTVKQVSTTSISSRDSVRFTARQPPAKPDSLQVKVLYDTLVKQALFDYTAMPETVLLFALGKSAVQQVYFRRLNFIAGILLKEKLLQVAVTGHSDKSGSPEINKALSLKRAQHVSTYLLSKGVTAEQINTTAVSYLEPAMKGNTRNANSQNRRVVIKFLELK